jgi:hypothetical protein
MLHNVEWWFCTDVSGQPVGTIFKRPEVSSVPTFRDNLSVPSSSAQKSLLYRRFGTSYRYHLQAPRSLFCTDVSGHLSVPSSSAQKSLLYRRFGTTYRYHLQAPRSIFCTDVSGQPIGTILKRPEISSVPTFRYNLSVPSSSAQKYLLYRRFGTTYRYHLQAHRSIFCTDVSVQPIGSIFKGQEVPSIPTFRDNLSVPSWRVQKYNLYRRFGTTYRAHLQRSSPLCTDVSGQPIGPILKVQEVPFVPTFRGKLSVPSSGGQKVPWTYWALKMGPIGCPETSVQNYHSTPRNIPEDRRYYLHRGGSLISLRLLQVLKDCRSAVRWLCPRIARCATDWLGSLSSCVRHCPAPRFLGEKWKLRGLFKETEVNIKASATNGTARTSSRWFLSAAETPNLGCRTLCISALRMCGPALRSLTLLSPITLLYML